MSLRLALKRSIAAVTDDLPDPPQPNARPSQPPRKRTAPARQPVCVPQDKLPAPRCAKPNEEPIKAPASGSQLMMPAVGVKLEVLETELKVVTRRLNLAVDLRLQQLCSALSSGTASNQTHVQQLVRAYRSSNPPTEAAAVALMSGIFDLRKALFYEPSVEMPMWQLTQEASALWSKWGNQGFRARGMHAPTEPGPIPCKQQQKIQTALMDSRARIPEFAPNSQCMVARVDQPGEPLDGQLELIATASAPGGTLFPWMGQLQLHESTEADRYEFEFWWRQTKLIVKPDPGCAATYANDYCGHDRSEQNRHRHGHKLNCHFSVLADREGRPYIFLQLNRDVKKGETLWIDYGASNWCLLVV